MNDIYQDQQYNGVLFRPDYLFTERFLGNGFKDSDYKNMTVNSFGRSGQYSPKTDRGKILQRSIEIFTVTKKSELIEALSDARAGTAIYIASDMNNWGNIDVISGGDPDNKVTICGYTALGGATRITGNFRFNLLSEYVNIIGFDFDGSTYKAGQASFTKAIRIQKSNNSIVDCSFVSVGDSGGGRNTGIIDIINPLDPVNNTKIHSCFFDSNHQPGIFINTWGSLPSAAPKDTSIKSNSFTGSNNEKSECIRDGPSKIGETTEVSTLIRHNHFDNVRMPSLESKSGGMVFEHNLLNGKSGHRGRAYNRAGDNKTFRYNIFLNQIRSLELGGDNCQVTDNLFVTDPIGAKELSDGVLGFVAGGNFNGRVCAYRPEATNYDVSRNTVIVYGATRAISFGKQTGFIDGAGDGKDCSSPTGRTEIPPSDNNITDNLLYLMSSRAEGFYFKPGHTGSYDKIMEEDNIIKKNYTFKRDGAEGSNDNRIFDQGDQNVLINISNDLVDYQDPLYDFDSLEPSVATDGYDVFGVPRKGRKVVGAIVISSDEGKNPAINPVMNKVTDPVMNPVIDPVIDPVMNPVIDPVMNPVIDPVMNPVIDPACEFDIDVKATITIGGVKYKIKLTKEE